MLADLLSLSVLACHCAWVCLVRALHLLGARNYLRAHRFSTDRLPRKEKAAGKSAPGELSVPHPHGASCVRESESADTHS